MQHNKTIKLTVLRAEDDYSLSKRKQRWLKNILTRNILSIVSRFNGTVQFTITISAKGNA